MTSVPLLPIGLAAALLATQATPAAGSDEHGDAATRLQRTVEQLRRSVEDLWQNSELRRPSRPEPAELDPEDVTIAACPGIGQAREPRVGLSPAVVPQLGRVTAPVLRFDAQPRVEMATQVT